MALAGGHLAWRVCQRETRCYTMIFLYVVLLFSLTIWAAVSASSPSQRPWEEHLRHLQPSSSPQQQEDAVRGLLRRLLKDRAMEFNVTVDPTIGSSDGDSFKITAQNGTAHITGSTGVAASSGILHYLKYSCYCHVSWEADQLDLPLKLPDATVERTALERYHYYLNICTLSYSTPFWMWQEWERGIDWMALSGINLALAPSGQEEGWRRVFHSIGLTDEELNEFFAGPPFLAWNRMGNIQGWGGPLSLNWTSQKSALNKQIVDRMREFGMMAVLPAFAGHVPEGLLRVYPSANITRLSAWGHFTDPYTRTYFLDPRDPLFKTIGSAFIKEITQMFGSDHLYSCDPFNEMTPISSDPSYLGLLGAAVLGAMTEHDPLGVWVMQGWMFVNDPGFWQPTQAKALLTSVPQGKLLILDLAAEILPQYRRFESFYGQPFVFCMLHNYGGVQGLFGNVDVMLKYLRAARASTITTTTRARTTTTNITLVGTGLTPEGINQNYVMYDLFTELMWTGEMDVPLWALNYAKRRYGSSDTRLGEAWQILMKSVYNCKTLMYNHGQYTIVTRPDVGRDRNKLWYSVADLVKAWDLIISVTKEVSEHMETAAILDPNLAVTTEEAEQNAIILDPTQSEPTATLLQFKVYPEETEMIYDRWSRSVGGGRRTEEMISGFLVENRETERREGGRMEEKREEGTEERIVEEEKHEEMRRVVRKVTEQETFKHDLVDITRQMLELIGGNMALRIIDDYKNGVLLALRESSSLLQDLLGDMDNILASSPAFLLGKWIDGAASWACTEQERNQYIQNALHQITLWGPTGEIVDYAIKQWSGIVSNYLRERWALFSERLEDSIVNGTSFDQLAFNFEVFKEVEKKFAMNVNATYPLKPKGNTVDLSLQLYRKYRPVFNSLFLEIFDKQFNKTTRRMKDRKRKLNKETVDEDGVGDENEVIENVEKEKERFMHMLMK